MSAEPRRLPTIAEDEENAQQAAGTEPTVAPAPPRHPFYALRYRNFRLFFFGQLISLAGSWMQMVAVQWLVFSVTGSSAWLGIVSGASAVPYLMFALLGGQTADRLPRRSILVWTQVAAMVSACALALLATNRWIPVQPWHIAALAGVGGVVNAFNMPAQQAFVTDMVEERHALGNAIALNSLMFNMARFVGPILAGSVLVRLGAAWCFGLNAVSFIAVIFSLLMMRLPPHEPRTRHETVWTAFAFIRSNTKVFRVISLVGAASLFAWSFSTLLPVFAERFHRGASGFTLLMTANGVGAALGGLMVATLAGRLHRKLMIYASLTLFCVGLFLFTTATEFWVAMGWLLFSGFTMISFAVNANTKVQEDVPDSLRGRVMAVYSMVFFGLMPLGGLEVGFLAERMGVAGAVRLNVALCLLVTAALWAWSRSEEKAPPLRIAA